MRFVDFKAGQVIKAGPYTLTEAEIRQFAGAYDPQWFHVDPEAAADGPFGGLIASGWHSCSLAMRLVVDTVLVGSESFASPGVAYVKWPHPLRPGDHLSLRATVLGTRRSSSKPHLGILSWRWQLFNHHGMEVLDLEATSLFDLRGAQG